MSGVRPQSPRSDGAFPVSHPAALQQQSKRQMRAMRIGLYNSSHVEIRIALQAIGSLNRLTKLHIAVWGNSKTDFGPLARLSLLEDLALKTACLHSSCEAVLNSNSQTLCSVRLDAPSWVASTYLWTKQLPYLDSLVIRIRELNAVQARYLAQIKATSAQLIVCQAPSQATYQAVSTAQLGFQTVVFEQACKFRHMFPRSELWSLFLNHCYLIKLAFFYEEFFSRSK